MSSSITPSTLASPRRRARIGGKEKTRVSARVSLPRRKVHPRGVNTEKIPMDPNGHKANNQEITGMLDVVLDKARHFAGTAFDGEIRLCRNARGAPDGTFQNDSSRCRMARGSAQRLPVFGTHGLFEFLAEGLPDDCAIATGQLRPDLPDRVQIAAKKLLDRAPGAIARSGENFIYTARAGFILLDFDTKGMPPAIKQKIEALGGFPNAIESVCPAFGKAGSILRSSTSSGIYNTATGEHHPDSGGLHVYVWVRDVSDAKRFLYRLHDRLWLAPVGCDRRGGRRVSRGRCG